MPRQILPIVDAQSGQVFGGSAVGYTGTPIVGNAVDPIAEQAKADGKSICLPLKVERVANSRDLRIHIGHHWTWASLSDAIALRSQLDAEIARLTEGFA